MCIIKSYTHVLILYMKRVSQLCLLLLAHAYERYNTIPIVFILCTNKPNMPRLIRQKLHTTDCASNVSLRTLDLGSSYMHRIYEFEKRWWWFFFCYNHIFTFNEMVCFKWLFTQIIGCQIVLLWTTIGLLYECTIYALHSIIIRAL